MTRVLQEITSTVRPQKCMKPEDRNFNDGGGYTEDDNTHSTETAKKYE